MKSFGTMGSPGPLIGRLPQVENRMRLSYERLSDPRLWTRVARDLGMTDREMQVSILLLKGLSSQEVATALGIKRGTVRTYCVKVYWRLRVRNRAEMVATILLASGLLLPQE